jgi:hypothetical protein
MSVDRQPKDAQALVQVMHPDRPVPIGRPALEEFAAPDVVDQHVDVAVFVADLSGKRLHLVGVEMVDGGGDTNATEASDHLSSLFDRLQSVVLGAT